MLMDFHIKDTDYAPKFVEKYIKFFNKEHPSYALGYLTPKAYREMYANKGVSTKAKS